jgi:hypothetical protein
MEMTFEPDAAHHILASFDVSIEDGYIVEEPSSEPIKNPDGEKIKAENLAIIEDGSTIFVDDNFDSIVKHVERQRE